jgi:hypothetical protein
MLDIETTGYPRYFPIKKFQQLSKKCLTSQNPARILILFGTDFSLYPVLIIQNKRWKFLEYKNQGFFYLCDGGCLKIDWCRELGIA